MTISIALQRVTRNGLRIQITRNETTPLPYPEDDYGGTWHIHGHIVANGIDIPISIAEARDGPAWHAIEVPLLEKARQIALSKEAALPPVFGGIVIRGVDVQNWNVYGHAHSNPQNKRHPFGLAVHYDRFSKQGVLLPEFRDMAMYERKAGATDKLWETHRGELSEGAAATFRDAVQAWWDSIEAQVLHEAKEGLGL